MRGVRIVAGRRGENVCQRTEEGRDVMDNMAARPGYRARGLILVTSVATALLAVAGCGSSGSAGAGGSGGSGGGKPQPGAIVFGSEISLTGQFAPFGAGVSQGLKAAEAAVNSAGGVLGHKIALDVVDDASDPVDSVPKANLLVSQDHVKVQVGEAGPDAQAIYKIFTKAGIPFLTPGGDTFFDTNTDPLLWRLTPSDNQLGVAMALWAHHQGYKRVALLFSTGVEQQLRAVVEATFKRLGGTIVDNIAIEPGQPSYESTVQGLVSSHPQAILTETDPPTMSVIVRELASLGAASIPVIGTDTMIGSDMIKAVGASTLHRIMTNCEAGLFSSPATGVFTAQVKQTSGSAPQANAEFGYDGVIIAALAMDESHSTSGPSFNAAISKVTAQGGTPVYSYSQGLKALKAGKQITYIGASGPFYYNAHHNVYGPFVCVQPQLSGQYKTLVTFSALQLKGASG
jgi:branched-chain amino acid transport system substrate-binding protein